MEKSGGTRLQSSVPVKGMEYICVDYDLDFYPDSFIVGRVYRVDKIEKCDSFEELKGNDYVYLKNEDEGLGGFPIRNGDKVYLENGVKIAYFDLYFKSFKQIRKEKLTHLKKLREIK